MDLYVWAVIGYAIFLGIHNAVKKKASLQSRESVVLVLFTGVCFLLSLIWIPFGVSIDPHLIWIYALKGLILATGWFFIFKILKDTDVSIVSLSIVLSSVITLFAGVLLFDESMTWIQIIGVIIIIFGIFAINMIGRENSKKVKTFHIIVLIIYAFMSSICAIIDKYTTTYNEPHQVQFWFLLFLFIFSSIFFAFDCFKNKKLLIEKSSFKNYWIYILSITLFLGDTLLYLSFKLPNASLMSITVISKLKTIIGVILGIYLFKEKHKILKILISILVVIGILLVSLG